MALANTRYQLLLSTLVVHDTPNLAV